MAEEQRGPGRAKQIAVLRERGEGSWEWQAGGNAEREGARGWRLQGALRSRLKSGASDRKGIDGSTCH